MYIWIMFMSITPHKEERFLYVIYYLICFNGAFSLSLLTDIINPLIKESGLLITFIKKIGYIKKVLITKIFFNNFYFFRFFIFIHLYFF